jgi:hypothetical protein
MPDVKGTALLPRGDKNGLAAVADALLKEPLRTRAALIVFDCKRGTEDYDLADTVLTVRIRRVELVLPGDLNAVEQMIRRALEFRSGQTTLDLELEDEIRKAFDAMRDPDSTEDPDEPGPEEGKKGGKQ